MPTRRVTVTKEMMFGYINAAEKKSREDHGGRIRYTPQFIDTLDGFLDEYGPESVEVEVDDVG